MAVNTITLREFQALPMGGPPPTVLDVRTSAEFARVHAVGARSSPLDELDPAAIAARCPSSDRPIYVICQSGGRSAKACQRLEDAGVGPTYSIEGGTTAWEQMGLPVVRGGGGGISMERQVRIGAGAMVLLGLGLAWAVHPGFALIAAFVGGGLVFAGVTDYCGMAFLLCKMPWNRK